MDLHHDAALRQDVTLLACVHDVTLLQNFKGKRSVGFVLQLHLERLFWRGERGAERRPNKLRLHSCRHVHGVVSTHKLHSTEAPHAQSADSVEVAQRHAGEEIGLGLQSAVEIKKVEGKTE